MSQHALAGSGAVTILAPPPRTTVLARVATVLCLATALLAFLASSAASAALEGGARLAAIAGVMLVVVALMGRPLTRQVGAASRARRAVRAGDIVEARHAAAEARHHSLQAMGYSGFVIILGGVALLLSADGFAVQKTFFQWDLIRLSAPDIAKAFGINVVIACSAQALSMAFGLVLALTRSLPGASFRPLRTLAVCYIDAFRSLPAIVVIYLVCLGIPLSGISYISEADPVVYAIIALSLTFSAYNAELFRSGMESVHHSQISAAHSLGLSTASVYRLVVLPQVARRLAPAMLGAFVMLQKDTALVNIVGIVDAFAQSKIYSGNYYNLSSIVVVCVLFIVCTIPQTRFVDYQLAKARRREMGA